MATLIAPKHPNQPVLIDMTKMTQNPTFTILVTQNGFASAIAAATTVATATVR